MKNQHLVPKNNIFVEDSNNDAMLLAASNIASRAHNDDSNQNQSEILRFPKNLDF